MSQNALIIGGSRGIGLAFVRALLADAALARDRRYVGRFVALTKSDGYASSVGETEQGISAIAVPIGGVGPVIGSLNIVFFTSAMTTEVAARRYLRSLKQAAADIERRWRTAQSADRGPLVGLRDHEQAGGPRSALR